ncbi:MAG: PKD domain-containing protein [Paludibacteraceae bacterium]|nr:PKD domain-containing protein [Paludibacteraceae bacterium]
MNKIILKIAFLVTLFVFNISLLCAEVIGYQCDFEDSTEVSLWNLNIGSQGESCVNKWYVGKPGAHTGGAGLFVSSDGVSNNYQNKGVSVVASRTLHFWEGYYDIVIEWKGAGANTDGLYVCWMPDSIATNSVASDVLQKFVVGEGYDVAFKFANSRLCGQTSWKKSTDIIYSDGTPHKLVFVWNNGVVSTTPPAACVDNIYIMQVGKCQNPSGLNLKFSDDGASFVWNGNSPNYDVRYRNVDSLAWIEHFGIVGEEIKIEDLEEGMSIYEVRSVCDGIIGEWITLEKYFHYPQVGCIDFLDINSSNCYYGTFKKPMSAQGVIDHGYAAEESRHTIHYVQGEYDVRVGGTKLKTIPDGEKASVRLGNWHTQAEAECIRYKYKVDTTKNAVLLLNYAIVMQLPDHKKEDQPRFTLKITKNGSSLDAHKCGEADFSAGFGTDGEGWGMIGSDGVYKDWTTVGLNLREHHGDTLTVELTTYDCVQEGHYGYAYFTLSCSDGKIQALSCGNDPKNSFKAPDGFNYRWYLPNNPDVTISTEQILSVDASDTLTYALDVIQKTNSNCYYTLSASTLARFPRARGRFDVQVENCQNVVNFFDSSYVYLVNQYTKDTVLSEDPVQDVLWDFGDGESSNELNPTHIFPDKGGKYTVTMSAFMANGACSDFTTFELNLPELETKVDTIHEVVCYPDSYVFKGKHYWSTGCYSDTAKTVYGCDSITVLDLLVSDGYDSLIVDTICSTDVYMFNGERITETGKYKFEGKTIHGCDSVITLDIVVYETLLIDVDTVVDVCVDDEYLIIPYEITSGRLGDYSFKFSSKTDTVEGVTLKDNAFVIPMPEGMIPNRYKAEISFGKQSCGKEKEEVLVDLMYSRDVIAQRWNDVLAVKNKDYNGGYDFVAFQWYKNSEAILGATSSVLYVEEGFNSADEYSVLLTRIDDNVSQKVCAIVPQTLDANEASVIIFSQEKEMLKVRATQRSVVKLWSTTGVLVGTYDLDGEGYISTEGLHGIFIIEALMNDGSRKVEKINIL